LLFDSTRGPHGALRGHVVRANPLWRQLGVAAGLQARNDEAARQMAALVMQRAD
jgi:predicted FMN-binding regulatory protein PaiB